MSRAEIADKFRIVLETSEAIARIRMKRKRTVEEAIELQHLIDRRRELRALIPGPTLAIDNTRGNHG